MSTELGVLYLASHNSQSYTFYTHHKLYTLNYIIYTHLILSFVYKYKSVSM